MNYKNGDILLEEIIDKNNLSIRSINVCRDSGLMSLNLMLEFYSKNGSFISIKNCGSKTNKELIKICNKYENKVDNIKNYEIIKNEEEVIIKTINNLSPLQKATLNKYFEYLLSILKNTDIRSYNGIGNISSEYIPKIVFEKIFSKNFNFNKIRNIGEKSVEILENLKNEIVSFITILESIEKDQLSREYSKLILKMIFPYLPESFENDIKTVFDLNGKIKIFKLISFLIESGNIFSKIQKTIFIYFYTNKYINNKSLESIGVELNITRERVRQVKIKLEEEIQNHFLFILNLNENDFVSYNINPLNSFQVIDRHLANKINENEEVDFNINFYSIIFEIFLKKTYSVLGNDKLIRVKRKIIDDKSFKNCYLINKSLLNCFKFEEFVEDIYFRVNDKISETYSLNFQGYLYSFMKEDGGYFFEEIESACQKIIFHEFELFVNFDGYLNFEQKTKKPIHQYYYEIIEEIGNLMHVKEIVNIAYEKFPFLDASETSVRGILNKEKHLFIYFGRTSTYGLRKWENEKENIKGGTIREIVEEFLEISDVPEHISNIARYVEKYREKTYPRSILDNLKADENSKFIFFSGSFIGLKNRSYKIENKQFKNLVGARFTSIALNKFLNWNLEDIIGYFISKYGYLRVQVEYILKQKIENGSIKISSENKLII